MVRLKGLFAVEGVTVGGVFDGDMATAAMPVRTAAQAC
jgi:hypothetical protein